MVYVGGGGEIDRNQFAVLAEDGGEIKFFAFFLHLSNAAPESLRQRGCVTPVKGWFMLAP